MNTSCIRPQSRAPPNSFIEQCVCIFEPCRSLARSLVLFPAVRETTLLFSHQPWTPRTTLNPSLLHKRIPSIAKHTSQPTRTDPIRIPAGQVVEEESRGF